MKSELIDLIEMMPNARRIHRDKVTDFVLRNKQCMEWLLELTFGDNKKLAIRASWILELVCVYDVKLLVPFFNYYVENLQKPKDESIIRPLAKICLLYVHEFSSILSPSNNLFISEIHKNKIIEVCFDWLINEHNVANHIYAMDTLYLLGNQNKWVHTELKLVLERKISTGSPGYQVRAKRLLKKLNI